jgi:quercetin dioxygenase-like cupin family protein
MRTPKRVVTGWDDNEQPIVLFSGPPPKTLDFESAQASELWVTPSSPADVHARTDEALGEWRLEPQPGGSAFRLVVYTPGAHIDLHTTETLDYIVVLSGELTLVLPDDEVTLGPGDTLVQQATPHGWANRTSEPCVMAAVLVSSRGECDP